MHTRPAHPLRTTAIFVAAATLLCFGIASPVVFGALPEEFAGLIVPVAQLTPLLTALVLFFVLRSGRLSDVFALRWGRSWSGVGVSLAAVVAIGLLQLGAGLATGHTLSSPDAVLIAAAAVPVLLVMQSVFAVGEELGWRGWLVTQLREKPFWLIAGVSAAAWVIWHLPALPLIVGDGGWEPGAAYLLAIASWAPFMVALRLWSGSVWPAVIVHGALNSVRVFLTQSIASGEGVNWLVELAGCVLWRAAAAVLHSRIRSRDARRSEHAPVSAL
ncbi:MAG: CPBP family glutamic-type intramembrane protease [Agrococcus casei]|uniref:CPBP family glutamic-type intramembrane protease n=1 Tax=Agrococcus casei TaxID=343512 RepID=UPI003F8E5BB3